MRKRRCFGGFNGDGTNRPLEMPSSSRFNPSRSWPHAAVGDGLVYQRMIRNADFAREIFTASCVMGNTEASRSSERMRRMEPKSWRRPEPQYRERAVASNASGP